MQSLLTLRNLPSLYKGVLLDQFGVLHDGRRPYSTSLSTLEYLHSNHMKIYLLSNSSQRSKNSYSRLESMGFRKQWITEIVTSGEMTHIHLLNRNGAFWENLGRRCLHFTWGARGKIQLAELGLDVITDPDQADFVLVHGVDAIGRGDGVDPLASTFEEMTEILKRCSERKPSPPMIVANPDFVTVDGSELKRMPGSFGRIYEAMGGVVKYMGKPGSFIYHHTLQAMNLCKEEVIAIGDSLEHDIKGAEEMGIASIFVCGGIHKEEIMKDGVQIYEETLKDLTISCSIQPTFYIDFFKL